jgi:hypothetical protein
MKYVFSKFNVNQQLVVEILRKKNSKSERATVCSGSWRSEVGSRNFTEISSCRELHTKDKRRMREGGLLRYYRASAALLRRWHMLRNFIETSSCRELHAESFM